MGRVKLGNESQLRVRLGDACFPRRRRRARYVLNALQSKHEREPCAPRHVQQQQQRGIAPAMRSHADVTDWWGTHCFSCGKSQFVGYSYGRDAGYLWLCS